MTRRNAFKQTAHGLLAACLSPLTQRTGRAAPRRRFFGVAQKEGVWRLVTPDGKPFFSLGVNCVDEGASKEKYRADKPEYAAFRYYPGGDDWQKATAARLRSWNFNTIGAWSSPKMHRQGLPYTICLHLGSSVPGGVPWCDIFGPETARIFDKIAREQVAPLRQDTNLIGWFSDNELGWWDETLLPYFLNQPENNATRQVLMRLIRTHYSNDFTRFSADWDAGGASSFPELTSKIKLTRKPGGRAGQLLDRWTFTLAEQYYRLAHEAIRRYDKNHLILGDRYAQWYPAPVAHAAKKCVDVISTNFGADWTNGAICHFFLDTLHRITGKPILITEYYFAANENRSGNKNTSGGFPTVQTQKERAASFRRNLTAFALLPYVVGAHWFQYTDEPSHGRGDGEDYNMGLIDIDNRPYETLDRDAHRACSTVSPPSAPRSPTGSRGGYQK